LSLARYPVLGLTLVSVLGIAQTSPPETVFGYSDFSQQSRIDRQFLAVPDARLAGQDLKTLTAEPHLAASKED
jgi:N-acetylated-alpha-linked acidic dipeptidase